ncbi:MAG: barstar family protein [Gemmataceae bacterium]
MIIHIDARKLTDAAGLHGALSEAFGFPATYGKNLDALVDCLSDLDNPATGMTKVHLFPGQTALLAISHLDKTGKNAAKVKAQVQTLNDVAAFVNSRRLEKKQPPLLAVAYDGD